MSLPHPVLEELLAGFDVCRIIPVSGGDICEAFRVDTSTGPVFAKCHAYPSPDMFAREASGLTVLAQHAPAEILIPEVLRQDNLGLVLNWIEPGHGSLTAEHDLGIGLAKLHRTTNTTFGSLDETLAGYLGSTEVDLTPTDSWAEFFLEHRLRPLARRAVDQGVISSDTLRLIDELEPQADRLCGPPEPPALLHGDLWAGNRLVDTYGKNWLIDPAAHWGHREYDLAMMRLFGGFGDEVFRCYHQTFPLAEDWQDRVRWLQLPALLVHAILFGGSYGSSALMVLRSYL